MKKRLIAIFILITVMLSSFIAPVVAQDANLRVGDKIVLAPDTVATYLGNYRYEAVIGDLQYLPDLVTLIDPSWEYDIDKKQWESRANLYDAIVKGMKVTVTYEGKAMSWQPEVFIGTKKQAPNPVADLLFDDPINEYYQGNILQWTYPEGITRNLRIIEGMLLEYYTIPAMPSDDIRIDPKTIKDIDFVWHRPSETWDAEGNRVASSEDTNGVITLTTDALQDVVFPVTIDPDTAFLSSSSDGYLTRSTQVIVWDTIANVWNDIHDDTVASWTSGGTVSYVRVWAWDDDDPGDEVAQIRLARSYLFFDTAGLPDDIVVDSALLKLYVAGKKTEMGNFDVIIQGGMPSYPHEPLWYSDYYYNNYSGDYGQLNTASMSLGQYNDWTLTAQGETAINKTGTTKFILREELHDQDDLVPSYGDYTWRDNEIAYYAYEKGNGYWPQLVVTYISVAPIITTDAASSIANTTARLNSTLVDDGYEPCEIRFGYGTTSKTAGNFTGYDTVTSWEGAYTTGEHPFYDASSLMESTPYYFRVQVRNSEATVTGLERGFDTTGGIDIPVVATNPANNVGQTVATLHGTLTYDGGENSEVRFQYYKSGGTWTDNETTWDAGYQTEETFEEAITALDADSLYYFRAQAKNGQATVSGSSRTFETDATPPEAPTVQTDAADNVGYSTARIHGTLTDDGGENSETRFQYGFTAGYGTDTDWIPGFSTNETFLESLAGLDDDQLYHYRAQAKNSEGTTISGADMTFETGVAPPVSPTVATQAATGIGSTSATLHSYLTNDGGEACEIRFQYGLTDAYGTDTAWVAGYTTGMSYAKAIAGLDADETYHFRVQAKNGIGTTNGDDLTFRIGAAMSAPFNFRGNPQATSISLSWAIGRGASQTLIMFRNDTYPTSETDGTQAYLGTSASYTHTGLLPGTSIYYSAWGESGGIYSAGYATVMITSSAGEVDVSEGLPTPEEPTRWMAAPNYENLSELPLIYDAINAAADTVEMPRETAWLMFAILLSVGAGIFIFTVTKKAFIGLITMTLALVFSWAIQIVPFWIPMLSAISVMAILWTQRREAY